MRKIVELWNPPEEGLPEPEAPEKAFPPLEAKRPTEPLSRLRMNPGYDPVGNVYRVACHWTVTEDATHLPDRELIADLALAIAQELVHGLKRMVAEPHEIDLRKRRGG